MAEEQDNASIRAAQILTARACGNEPSWIPPGEIAHLDVTRPIETGALTMGKNNIIDTYQSTYGAPNWTASYTPYKNFTDGLLHVLIGWQIVVGFTVAGGRLGFVVADYLENAEADRIVADMFGCAIGLVVGLVVGVLVSSVIMRIISKIHSTKSKLRKEDVVVPPSPLSGLTIKPTALHDAIRPRSVLPEDLSATDNFVKYAREIAESLSSYPENDSDLLQSELSVAERQEIRKLSNTKLTQQQAANLAITHGGALSFIAMQQRSDLMQNFNIAKELFINASRQ